MEIDLKSKKIIADLKSSDQELVIETIELVRESGNHHTLAGIIELLHDTEHIEIKKSILNLLSELKDKESIPVLIAAIQDEKYINERKDLVSSCWQNGLTFNEYLPFFIDLIIQEEFLIAFEAFTVIENMVGKIEEKVIDAEIIKINEALKATTEQKAYFLKELLTIIQDIPEKQEYVD